MNFDFSDDQKELGSHARRFLGDSCTFDHLRRHMASGADLDSGLWRQMVELGWTAINVPEDAGGMGLGALELCVLAEETGRALPPVPFFSTVCLGSELLRRCDSDAARDLLAKIVAGDAIVACALRDPASGRLDGAGRVDAVFSPLADAGPAQYLLALVRDVDDGAALALVNLSQPGVRRERLAAWGLDDLASHGTLQLAAVPSVVLASGAAARELVTTALDQAAVLTAFAQVGGAEVALHMARDYSLERYTFGRAIGGYQAIKHKLADVLVDIELARSNAYYGAWAMATGSPELPRAAALARISATEAFTRSAEESMQVHGGIGYTWEANCHFYYRRARLLAISLGHAGEWSERLLATI